MIGYFRKLYLIVFQRFIMTLSDFLNECESKNVDPVSTPWLKWIIERLQEIFLLYHEQVFQYVSTFESLIFTSDIDFCILEVFQQFCALRA
jgi:nuclear cap-binding protein subunit 1